MSLCCISSEYKILQLWCKAVATILKPNGWRENAIKSSREFKTASLFSGNTIEIESKESKRSKYFAFERPNFRLETLIHSNKTWGESHGFCKSRFLEMKDLCGSLTLLTAYTKILEPKKILSFIGFIPVKFITFNTYSILVENCECFFDLLFMGFFFTNSGFGSTRFKRNHFNFFFSIFQRKLYQELGFTLRCENRSIHTRKINF